MNRSYRYIDEVGAPEVRLREGHHLETDEEIGDHEYFTTGPVYGDLTGDGQDEAVVRLQYNDGGGRNYRLAQVFTVRACQVVRLGVIPEENDGLFDAFNERVENERLVVERYDRGGVGNGDPQSVRTEYWHIVQDVLVGEVLVEDLHARTVRRWQGSNQ